MDYTDINKEYLDYEVIIIYYLLSKRRKERIEKFLKENVK